MKLAAEIICKNEEKTIERCIHSVLPVVDEVVVLDTGSDDDTKMLVSQLAGKHSTVSLHLSRKFTWKTPSDEFHFADARNECLAHVSADWVLSIDADETFEYDRDALREVLDVPRDVCPLFILNDVEHFLFYGSRLFRFRHFGRRLIL